MARSQQLIAGCQLGFDNKIWEIWDFQKQQDKYTIDPGQLSLSQHKEQMFWPKMIFEQKINKKNA